MAHFITRMYKTQYTNHTKTPEDYPTKPKHKRKKFKNDLLGYFWWAGEGVRKIGKFQRSLNHPTPRTSIDKSHQSSQIHKLLVTLITKI